MKFQNFINYKKKKEIIILYKVRKTSICAIEVYNLCCAVYYLSIYWYY